MGSYEDTVRTLEVELAQVEQAFRTWATTWPGCGRRRAGGPSTPTRGCP